MPCLLNRQEHLEKLKLHQAHYLQIEPQLKLPVAKKLVRQPPKKAKEPS